MTTQEWMSRDGGLDLSPKIMGDGATEGEVERANRHGIVVQLPKGCLARLHRTEHTQSSRERPSRAAIGVDGLL